MTHPAPDWADEEIKRLSASYWDGIAGDETSVSRCEAAISLRAAYERGKADGERSGIIRGLREAADISNERAAICEDAVREIEKGHLYAETAAARATENCARMEASHITALIRARIDELEKGKP